GGDRGGYQGGDRREGGFKPREDRGGDRGGFRRNEGSGSRPQTSTADLESLRDDETARRPHNPADLRSSNSADRGRSPEIDDDVTGKELDRITRAELRYLDETNNEWVSKHLVMAGRLIDIDPMLAYEHTIAASRRGGRVAVVREAVGLAAYAAGEYAEALREFRTHRRISGSNLHLPLIADAERGIGRPSKTLEIAHSEVVETLDTNGKVEMAMVASGAQNDLGNLEAALAELEIPQLELNRAFSYSPRLFSAYADALENLGRNEEAATWRKQISVAEEALGTGEFEEPEIIDLGEDDEADARRPRARDIVEPEVSKADDDPEASPEETPGALSEEDAVEVVDAGSLKDPADESNPDLDTEEVAVSDPNGASPAIDQDENDEK
ncbi:MAG: hypothetical protein Q4P23_08250, partial [Micrococcaceae bacterium]|nr:hypothetical protein [Micrococcaceae bacterium]